MCVWANHSPIPHCPNSIAQTAHTSSLTSAQMEEKISATTALSQPCMRSTLMSSSLTSLQTAWGNKQTHLVICSLCTGVFVDASLNFLNLIGCKTNHRVYVNTLVLIRYCCYGNSTQSNGTRCFLSVQVIPLRTEDVGICWWIICLERTVNQFDPDYRSEGEVIQSQCWAETL